MYPNYILALLQEMWISHDAFNAHSLSTSDISIALENWKSLWESMMSNTPPDLLEYHGFYRFAAIEFWELARLMHGRNCLRLSEVGGLEALLRKS